MFKISGSLQDWCGQSFVQLNRRKGGWRMRLFSYFQGEGDQDREVGDAWTEDGLWIQLRLDPRGLPVGEISVIPGMLSFRFSQRPLAVEKARAKLEESGERYLYTLKYPKSGRLLELEADLAFPHVIRTWRERGGRGRKMTTGTLTHLRSQVEYWRMNRREDWSERESLGLQ